MHVCECLALLDNRNSHIYCGELTKSSQKKGKMNPEHF